MSSTAKIHSVLKIRRFSATVQPTACILIDLRHASYAYIVRQMLGGVPHGRPSQQPHGAAVHEDGDALRVKYYLRSVPLVHANFF